MRKKTVPLLKISSEESIYFDFSTNELFIQTFEGPFTEASGKKYSTTATASLSVMISFVVIPVLAIKFDSYFAKSAPLITLFFSFVGISLGYLFIYIFLIKSKGKKIKTTFTKREIDKIIANKVNIIRVVWIYRMLVIGYIIFLLVSVFMDTITTKNILYNCLSAFVVSGLHFSSYPNKQMQVFKILKKQRKEGKYDE